MAKVPFSKLKCKVNTCEVPLQLGEETTSVKQYLPIQEKLGLISRVIEQAHEQDNNYSNPVKIKVFKELEMVFAYADISFTAKQKEDIPKLYDLLYSSGIIAAVLNNIPLEEKVTIDNGIEDTIKAVYDYQNSAYGILNGIKGNYDAADFDVEKLRQSLKEVSETPLVKDIIPLLGLE